MILRILAVVLYQIREGDVQQIRVAEYGNQTVIIFFLVREEQVDAVFRMRPQDEFSYI